jgi:tripartite-type tricarboxylate transporter receptor subunit TctC
MSNLDFSAAAFVVSSIAFGSGASLAADYPTKPIRILLTSSPGGGSDVPSRIIAQSLTESLGQQIIVDNRPATAIEIAHKAPADGYTLLVDATSFWIAPLLRKMTYDPLRDFSPISKLTTSPLVVVVHPGVANSIKELIALAKAKPGQLNYAGGPTGSSGQLAGELFKSMAGVNIVRINYQSIGLAYGDVISGQVQLMFPSVGSAAPHLKSGRLKVLGVTGAKPSALLPEVPTVAASGLPGYEAGLEVGIFAPAGTPAARIARLNREVVQALQRPDVRQKLLSSGVEPSGSSSEQLALTIKSDIAKWGKVIKDAGIRDE